MNEGEVAAGLAPTAKYCYAQRVASQLFIAGQVPHDAGSNLVGKGDPAAQAIQCLENLFTLIELHGFEQRDIRKLIIYVAGDEQNLTDAWSVISKRFDDQVPPATLLGVNLLGYTNQLVEIDATILKE